MSSFTQAFYEVEWIGIAINFAAQGSQNSNWYDMEEFHRAAAVLMTGAVGAGEDVRIGIYTATDGTGTGRTLVKQMTVAQAVNGNDDLALVELRTEEMMTALVNAKFIRIEATATLTPEYGVLLLRRVPRFPPVDVTHIDRLIA